VAANKQGSFMKHLAHWRAGLGVAATVFAGATWPAAATAGTLQTAGLFSLDAPAASRLFYKLSYINAHVRTSSKDAYDVTGPVLTQGDFGRYLYDTGFVSSFQTLQGGQGLRSMDLLYDPTAVELAGSIEGKYTQQADASGCEPIRNGLGTPCGVKVKADTTLGTVALSLGYFLDEQRHWAIEGMVLGAPLQAAVLGDGDNHLRGKKIIDTKLLPPIVTLGRYFGNPDAGLQAYAGLGVSYAIFYDTHATPTLNAYEGGANDGDTTVRIGSVFGTGPFMGLNYNTGSGGWQFGLQIGKLRYKTESTLVTRNTHITSSSEVLRDFGAYASSALVGADGVYSVSDPNKAVTVKVDGAPVGFTAGQTVHVTTAVLCDLARAKYGSQDCNQGTFVRKASTTLDNTLFVLSVSRAF
jgi:outer membrane protein W